MAQFGGETVKERLYNTVWGLGVRAIHIGKRLGISGPFERVLEKVALRFIPIPKEEVEVSVGNGIKLLVPPGFPRARTYAAGRYEEEVTRLVQSLLKEGMIVVDVGAFVGYYTLLASRLVRDSGRVYAFEPHPKNYDYLLRNILANGCRNVTAVNKAVFSSTGWYALAVHREADHFWLAPPYSSLSDAVTVPTVTLDDFFRQEGWPSIDLIKMDIEGGEQAALGGMRELSRRNPHLQLIMEYDLANLRRAGAKRESMAALLGELGFRKGYIIERGMKSFTVPWGLPKTRAAYNLLLKKD